jgi:hypothetical protein
MLCVITLRVVTSDTAWRGARLDSHSGTNVHADVRNPSSASTCHARRIASNSETISAPSVPKNNSSCR